MKTIIITFIVCIQFIGASAQERRLFLVDDYHGNYKEINLNEEILFSTKSSKDLLEGKILEIKSNSLIFQNKQGVITELPVDNIMAIGSKNLTKGANSNPVVIVIKYVVGTLVGIYGVGFMIGGLVIMTEEIGPGAAVFLIGVGISTLSYSLLSSASKGGKPNGIETNFTPLDGSRYQLLIDSGR